MTLSARRAEPLGGRRGRSASGGKREAVGCLLVLLVASAAGPHCARDHKGPACVSHGELSAGCTRELCFPEWQTASMAETWCHRKEFFGLGTVAIYQCQAAARVDFSLADVSQSSFYDKRGHLTGIVMNGMAGKHCYGKVPAVEGDCVLSRRVKCLSLQDLK